jgi:ribosomal protein S18 acetylase RimI-like enzyme
MMKSVESELRKIACPKINLQIRSGNAKVMKFYQKLGFTDDLVLSMGKRLEEDHS